MIEHSELGWIKSMGKIPNVLELDELASEVIIGNSAITGDDKASWIGASGKSTETLQIIQLQCEIVSEYIWEFNQEPGLQGIQIT